jgi:hypothetical protein
MILAVLTLVGIVVTGCAPSDASAAAKVYQNTISMTAYTQFTRVIFELGHVQDPTQANWQNVQGRSQLGAAKQQALQTLIANDLLDHAVRDPKSGVTLTKDELNQFQANEKQQLKQLFASVPAQYKPLTDQGILTPETYQPQLHNQLLEQAAFGKLKVDTAHIRILTVKDQATANDLLTTQKLSADNWADLAQKYSTDPAKSAGGDIAFLVPGVFPTAIDTQVFTNTPKDSATIAQVKSSLGVSLIQVVSVTRNVAANQLDGTVPVYPGGTESIQGAAFFGWLESLYAQSGATVNVNYCGNISGKACPGLFKPYQLAP